MSKYETSKQRILDFLQVEGVKTTEDIRFHLAVEYPTVYGWLRRLEAEKLIQGTKRKRSAQGWQQRRWRITPRT